MDWIELTLRPPKPPLMKPLTPDPDPPNNLYTHGLQVLTNPNSTPVTSNRRDCFTPALTKDLPHKEPWKITKRWPKEHRRRRKRRERSSESKRVERER